MFEEAYLKVLNTPREIRVGPYSFTDVAVVDDEKSIHDGLMYFKDIPNSACMLFKFPDMAERAFWMKNCHFPIVLLFIDENMEVTSVYRMKVEEGVADEELTRYESIVPVKYALEFKDNWMTDTSFEIKPR